MSEWTQQEIDQTLEEIKRRTLTDPDFRETALSDPNAAIAKVNPKPIPDEVSIKFADNSGKVKTIVLPDPIAAADELTDAELEEVAGGDNNNSNSIKLKL